jgi:hypothetical protein
VFKPIFTSLLALSLSACTSIPISSMYKLSRIDFMTTDLSRMRIAIALPTDLKPRPGGVHMDLAYQQGDGPEEKRVLKLEDAVLAADFVGLPQALSGNKTYVYNLSKDDVTTLNKIRSDAAIAKTKGQKGSLSMGVAAKEFCANNTISNSPLLVTTYVFTSENNEYVVLTRDIDLRGDKSISASLDHLEPCSK